MKKITENEITLVFYQKPSDQKYSFLIEGQPELTEKLLQVVKNKRINESDIHFAAKAIFSRLPKLDEEYSLLQNSLSSESNPISELNLKCQKLFGKSILTRVVNKSGADHCPTITVEIELPNAEVYSASGLNQKEAKQQAALAALEDLGI